MNINCLFKIQILLLLAIPNITNAAFIDVDDSRNGLQTVSWDESITIKIFIPKKITGADRMNFEMGIEDVVSMFDLQIKFEDGPAPANSLNSVEVVVMDITGTDFGQGGFFVPDPFPNNSNHASVNTGFINIDPDALGHSGVASSFIKNLGAHEFGHVLGLDHDNGTVGNRVNVMDPGFSLIFDSNQKVIRADPFVSMSERDKMMMEEHYERSRKGLPVPGTLWLVALGALGLRIISKNK